MRHRFHALCPYFAMFPESFAESGLSGACHGDGVGGTGLIELATNRLYYFLDPNEGLPRQRAIPHSSQLAVDAVEATGLRRDEIHPQAQAETAAGNGTVDEATHRLTP